jgi:dipeptidyl aminopeptidase/acylaminoacyl peptidase
MDAPITVKGGPAVAGLQAKSRSRYKSVSTLVSRAQAAPESLGKVGPTVLRVVLFVSALLVVLSLWGFYVSIRPPKILSSITPADLNMAYEDISFKTADGLTLRGWYIPCVITTDKTLILLHGYPADKGNILPPLAFLHGDFNLLLFDFRYLGESAGSYSTVGAREVEDLLAAIRFLEGRGITRVGVWGFSMGGAVALMTIEKAPGIRAVVSESSYANLADMALQLFRIPLLNYPMAGLVRIWAMLFLGIDLSHVAPAQRVRGTKVPILLLHSSADDVIPFSQAESLRQALAENPRAEFWFTERNLHGQLASDYQQRVREFFLRHIY